LTFADLGLPEALVAVLAAQGIDAPFAIQAATLPDALAGHDVCGRAPTGSGKTLAFGLPLLAGLAAGDRWAKPGRPLALILLPTRELAAQVTTVLAPLARAVGASLTAVYGGVGYGAQKAALRRGVDLLVGCPGRIEDLVAQGDLDLSEVRWAVLDEADRMADMGFLPAVRRLLDQVGPARQMLLFSATLDGDVDVVVRRYLDQPRRHEVVPADEPTGDVTHLWWRTDRDRRIGLTAELVASQAPAVVFCRTRHGADRLTQRLQAAGVSAVAVHGSRSQPQRDRALADFAGGRVDALVATDVAARGIHVDGVACVVHFDPPGDEKDYVHRSGRTGRAGADGLVVSLVTPEVSKDVAALQRALGQRSGVTAPDVAALPAAPPRRPPTPAAARPGAGRSGPGRPPRSRSRATGAGRPASGSSLRAGHGDGPRRSDGPGASSGSRRSERPTGPRRSEGVSGARRSDGDAWPSRRSDGPTGPRRSDGEGWPRRGEGVSGPRRNEARDRPARSGVPGAATGADRPGRAARFEDRPAERQRRNPAGRSGGPARRD